MNQSLPETLENRYK